LQSTSQSNAAVKITVHILDTKV